MFESRMFHIFNLDISAKEFSDITLKRCNKNQELFPFAPILLKSTHVLNHTHKIIVYAQDIW